MPDKKKKSNEKPPVYPKKSSPKKKKHNKKSSPLPPVTITAPTLHPKTRMEIAPKRERSRIVYDKIKPPHEITYPKPSTKKKPPMIPTRNKKTTMLRYLESDPTEKATRKSHPVRVPREDRDLVFLTNFTSDRNVKPKSKKKKNKK